jgi:hypothetical protein
MRKATATARVHPPRRVAAYASRPTGSGVKSRVMGEKDEGEHRDLGSDGDDEIFLGVRR